jgi:hypothetical protein
MDVDESSQSDATVTSGKGTPVPEETTLVPGTSKTEPKVLVQATNFSSVVYRSYHYVLMPTRIL